MPDGEFDAVDGRPGNMPGVKAKKWLLNEKAAKAVIARYQARGLKLVIDYEHQTLKAAENGHPAPAAAWITGLEYEPASAASKGGLMATVEWVGDGGELVAERKYLYLSPVFLFDPETGEVLSLHSVALTNTPALNSLGEIAAMAALAEMDLQRRLPGSGSTPNPEKETTMDKTKVLVALGLALDTGDDTAFTALSALKARHEHIPLDEHKKVTGELAALKESQDKGAHEQLMTAALADARILPANEAYWRKQPLVALQEFLKDAKPVAAALSGMQTGGKPPAGAAAGVVALSEDELAVCKSMGLSPEAFAKAKTSGAAA
jgi:phage I-like protein